MNLTGDALLELLLTPMTDIKMIETIDALGWEQPVIDEQYLMDLHISIFDDQKTGIGFRFEELTGYTAEGEPCLVKIDLYHDKNIIAPFGLSFSDNYEKCCAKIGHIADYNTKIDDDIKIWIIDSKYRVSITFKDSKLNSINGMIITPFNNTSINKNMYKNEA